MTDWDAIVSEHGPLVWQTAYRLLSHEADAADCYQRTFLAAVALDRKEPVGHWPAVLKRLATARALEQLRARYRTGRRLSVVTDDVLVESRVSDPLEFAAGEELADQLRRALTELEPLAAEIFCLTCLDGWSYEDVGAPWGMTANHVGVLLSRARAALRKRLQAFHPSAINEGVS